MANFDKFILQIEKNFEGGYQNFPNDNGNYTGGWVGEGNLVGTNHGIAAVTLKQWLKREPTVQDMKNLSVDDAKHIFKSLFWDAIFGDKLMSQGIAEFLFDWSLGSGYWVKELNRVLNTISGTKLPTTGLVPFTTFHAQAINNISDSATFLKACKTQRENWYYRIVKESPDQKMFLNSWLSRTEIMFNKWINNLGTEVKEVVADATTTVKSNPGKTLAAFFLSQPLHSMQLASFETNQIHNV